MVHIVCKDKIKQDEQGESRQIWGAVSYQCIVIKTFKYKDIKKTHLNTQYLLDTRLRLLVDY